MKLSIKMIACVLTVALAFSCLLSACTPAQPQAGTSQPTEMTSTEPTQPTTEPTTESTTESTTDPPTEAPTEPPTEPPTEAPTEPPTEAPTEAPTEPPTEPPTQPPTEAPTQPPTEPASPLTAANAFIYDYETGDLQVIRGSMDKSIDPASITKLFTAYIALQLLEPEHITTVGNIIDTVPDNSSFAWIHKGDVLTVEQLIYGMMLPSGGDAARALAAEAGRALAEDPSMSDSKAYELFLSHMNQWLADNGMTGTHFANADGYPSGDRYSCMRDILQMVKLCFEHPLMRTVMGTAKYSVTLPDRTMNWSNTNQLLHPGSEFYIPTAIGMKTGYTPKAGRCLVSVFCIDGKYTIMGVFGCPESSRSGIAQFENSCYLYNTYIAP